MFELSPQFEHLGFQTPLKKTEQLYTSREFCFKILHGP